MSDAYNIGEVTITPLGGGYYDITHPSLEGAERVRGKEAADTRAAEINAANTPSEGHIEPQGDLTASAAPAIGTVEISAEELAKLRADAADAAALREQIATVRTTEGAPPPSIVGIPGEYTSILSDEQKDALKIGFSRIILEDNADIPPTGLFVAHNGRPYMIQPGEVVDIPDFLREVLDHAVISVPVVDNKTQQVMGYRNRSKYPYRRVD